MAGEASFLRLASKRVAMGEGRAELRSSGARVNSWEGRINPLYLYRDITIQYGPDIYNGENFLDMELQNEEYTKHAGGLVRVYKVVDNSPGKDKGKAYYHLSPYEEESAVEARIRDKVKSKTALGGIKLAAKKMDALGKDYGELFTVKPVSGWINRTRAAELRNKLSKNAKAKAGKLYNKVKVSADSNFDL